MDQAALRPRVKNLLQMSLSIAVSVLSRVSSCVVTQTIVEAQAMRYECVTRDIVHAVFTKDIIERTYKYDASGFLTLLKLYWQIKASNLHLGLSSES